VARYPWGAAKDDFRDDGVTSAAHHVGDDSFAEIQTQPAAGESRGEVVMSTGQSTVAFIVMAMGMFMASLDIQIVTSSLREIQAGLSATADEVSQVQTSYLIAEVIMIPLSGWLSRMLSTRWLFTLSAIGFTVTSVACGMAWSLESMVVFRALQGFLGGAMIPTVFAAGMVMFRGAAQMRVPAILGLVATLAPALGPTIGGYITETLSWRWLFFINVLPGIVIILIVPRVVRIDKPDFGLLKRFDVLAAGLLVVFLGGIQFTLEEGPRRQWLDDPLLQWMTPIALLAGAVFVLRTLHHPEPLVELRAFKQRNFAIGCVLSFAVGVGLYGSIYLTPVFLGSVRGLGAQQIGGIVFVVGLANIVATPLTVALMQRVNFKLLLLIGFAIFMASCIMFVRIDANWGKSQLLLPQILRGIATMVCIIPVTGLALGALPVEHLKGGSGIYNLMRNLGGAIGLAVINSQLFYERLSFHRERLFDKLSAATMIVQERAELLTSLLGRVMTDDDMIARVTLMLTSRLGLREALTMSVSDVFVLMAVFFVFPMLLVLFIDSTKIAQTNTAEPN
jgi:DHA2 family multidrug resistance protein